MNPKFVVLSLDLLVYSSPCPLLSHFKTSMDDIFASSYVESKQQTWKEVTSLHEFTVNSMIIKPQLLANTPYASKL